MTRPRIPQSTRFKNTWAIRLRKPPTTRLRNKQPSRTRNPQTTHLGNLWTTRTTRLRCLSGHHTWNFWASAARLLSVIAGWFENGCRNSESDFFGAMLTQTLFGKRWAIHCVQSPRRMFITATRIKLSSTSFPAVSILITPRHHHPPLFYKPVCQLRIPKPTF